MSTDRIATPPRRSARQRVLKRRRHRRLDLGHRIGHAEREILRRPPGCPIASQSASMSAGVCVKNPSVSRLFAERQHAVHRQQPVARLEPGHAAVRRRPQHRSDRLRAERERHHAGGDGRRRSARAAARRVRRGCAGCASAPACGTRTPSSASCPAARRRAAAARARSRRPRCRCVPCRSASRIRWTGPLVSMMSLAPNGISASGPSPVGRCGSTWTHAWIDGSVANAIEPRLQRRSRALREAFIHCVKVSRRGVCAHGCRAGRRHIAERRPTSRGTRNGVPAIESLFRDSRRLGPILVRSEERHRAIDALLEKKRGSPSPSPCPAPCTTSKKTSSPCFSYAPWSSCDWLIGICGS